MPDYAAFGGCLRSELIFPELRERTGCAIDWTLRTAPAVPSRIAAQQLGESVIAPGCRVRMYRHAHGYRLEYDDTGCYDVSADGRDIVWSRGPTAPSAVVRSDVTGRVLATALHAGGVFCLHGCAVALQRGAVALLAPRFHGKSTLALALARGGGRLITDDVLPVIVGPPARAIPGMHQVKLWEDSATMMGVRQRDAGALEKHLVYDFPDAMLMFEPSPLAAIYLLAPAVDAASGGRSCARAPVATTMATMALVRHATLGELMGGSQAAVLLGWATALAQSVPVYRLDVVPGLERLPDVVAQIFAWHGESADRPAGVEQ
ncbi:MAG: hypothetical protein ACREOJ_20835 [Gemmatimonadaceae bacterium]